MIDVETDLGSRVRLSIQVDNGLLKGFARLTRIDYLVFFVFLFLRVVEDILALEVAVLIELFALNVPNNTFLVVVIVIILVVDGVDAGDRVVVSWDQQLILGARVHLASDKCIVFVTVGWWNTNLLELLSTTADLLADLFAGGFTNIVRSWKVIVLEGLAFLKQCSANHFGSILSASLGKLLEHSNEGRGQINSRFKLERINDENICIIAVLAKIGFALLGFSLPLRAIEHGRCFLFGEVACLAGNLNCRNSVVVGLVVLWVLVVLELDVVLGTVSKISSLKAKQFTTLYIKLIAA